MSIGIKLGLLLSLLGTGGCTFFNSPQQLPDLPLLPPADFLHMRAGSDSEAGRQQFLEQVTMVTADAEQVMLAAWVVSAERLDLVGLTPTGQRLLSLSYDGREFSEDYSLLLREPIPGRMILSHLQLAHWPERSVEQGLTNTPWRMNVVNGQRQFFIGRQQIMTITRDSQDTAVIHINSEPMNFTLHVRELVQ